MQPTTHASTTHALARSRRRRPALGALALAVGLVLAGCGSSGGDAQADGGTTSTTAADGGGTSAPDDGMASTTTAAGSSSIDLCAEVTAEQVSDILGVTATASPNPALSAPSCNYTRDIGGVQGNLVRIDGNDPSFFASQQELQTEEQPVPELGDRGFALTTGSTMVYVQGKTATWLVTQGVELEDGGQPATLEQLTAIAKLLVDL